MNISGKLALAALAALIVVSGCSKKAPDGIDEVLARSGIVAWQGAGVYVQQGDAAPLSWRGALDFGGELKMAPGKEPVELALGEQRFTFVPLAVDSGALAGLRDKLGEGPAWIRADYYGAGAEAAAVVKATGGGDGQPALPRGALVAVFRSRASGAMAPAILVDPISKTRTDGAVATGDLSFGQDDVRAATFLAKASAARDEAESRGILEDAMRAIPNSAFSDLLAARLGQGGGGTAAAAADEPGIEALVARLTVKNDGTAVRSAPDAASESVGTLAMDDEVEVSGRSQEAQAGEGGNAHWYRITSPAEGWVFGLDLVGAD